MYGKIDLSNSALSRKEKARLMKMLNKYIDAFSLRDKIGECPNLEADIKVIDESPFFVRPFSISPVMLITRKLTKDKRPVVDFRLLNTRIL